jgi:FKBP-type peptidyl-prolyl cis-trans isomerase 2
MKVSHGARVSSEFTASLDDQTVADFNHLLAGRSLSFKVKVLEVKQG